MLLLRRVGQQKLKLNIASSSVWWCCCYCYCYCWSRHLRRPGLIAADVGLQESEASHSLCPWRSLRGAADSKASSIDRRYPSTGRTSPTGRQPQKTTKLRCSHVTSLFWHFPIGNKYRFADRFRY
ncbi:hypothetical protein F441_15699 [Phytophthora nicotianae CJ01A1]|uniref:Uncharacterized protein n=5 Tax=Phytophthora nicotianae TaxID=4792 RepID=W2R2G1_PHYN3|nr:hypothetical protein PPTG_21481 [Phytophthora nicotianae INRA-310]ETI38363.1 hypothetical protein F443_15866 [Phytophthora nicotianae P1569]ETK78589.1 hypothetical protein L915_15422 [Phytophthora nicotianae]ETO67134.1 hypothetical protein F444_15847 [Phytophthora nicotianae P1976]ETP08243.1 hypothetical protein F441_15699 [Phytophthora nicotianae CJ01A1]ETL32020.1 hypothetical protein L916_15316 [Phytophthora nicotianae]